MSHAFAHAVKHTFEHAGSMTPVGRGKSPAVAFLLGVCFGAVGVGLYLRSWSDFVLLLALFIFGSVVTAGLAAPLCWAIAGAWGARRVMIANSEPVRGEVTRHAA